MVSIKISEFQEKRMKIFGELVKRYWNGQLKEVKDLDELAQDIMDKYNFKDSDLGFIKDHIRVAMGLNPRGNVDFNDELDLIRNSKVIADPIVAKIEGPCEHCDKKPCHCRKDLKYEAPIYNRNTEDVIVDGKCLSCGECINDCDYGAIADKIEFVPLIDLLKENKTPVYATVAPAIAGQFGDDVSLGQIRTALKMIGFTDMIEVALFADILTIKEAFEFSHIVQTEDDLFLTSCCCPVWFNMIKKNYPEAYKRISPSVSPMIASGRILKKLHKDIKVVFIAPCIAKKAEINEPDLKGAIDYVINFRELKEIFESLNIDLKSVQADEKDQGSLGGRLYARTGGVSFSIKTVVNRLEPTRLVKLKALKVDGVKDCKALLESLSEKKDLGANFIEGMGCPGGCVGGPRTNIDADKGTKVVNEVGEDSLIMTPFDNLNVMVILKQLGLKSIEEIMTNKGVFDLLTRNKF